MKKLTKTQINILSNEMNLIVFNYTANLTSTARAEVNKATASSNVYREYAKILQKNKQEQNALMDCIIQQLSQGFAYTLTMCTGLREPSWMSSYQQLKALTIGDKTQNFNYYPQPSSGIQPFAFSNSVVDASPTLPKSLVSIIAKHHTKCMNLYKKYTVMYDEMIKDLLALRNEIVFECNAETSNKLMAKFREKYCINQKI